VLKCDSKPEGKSLNQFLFDKALEFKDSMKQEKLLLSENEKQQVFIRLEREKMIPIWTSDVDVSGGKTNGDDDMSYKVDENWEEELI